MCKILKSLLTFTAVMLCVGIPISTSAGIGAEPSNQPADAGYSSEMPFTSMMTAPDVIPGLGADSAAVPQYPVPSFNSEMMASQAYPAYPDQSYRNIAPGYGTMPNMPSQQYNPSMPDMMMQPYQHNPSMPDMMMQPYQPYGMGNIPGGYMSPYQEAYPPMSGQGMPYLSQPQYGSADQVYTQAMQAYRSRDYWTALSKFGEVVTVYPQSDLADNAYYWIGEIYYGWKNYPEAIRSFQTVSMMYPNGNKLPDAMLKMGYAYAEMRYYEMARSILNDVSMRFSNNTRIRDLAMKKLSELGTMY